MRKGLPFICSATLILGGGSLALAAPQNPDLATLSETTALVLPVADGDRSDAYFFEIDDSDGDYSDGDYSDPDNDGRRPLWLKHLHDDDRRAVPRGAYRDSDDDGDFDDSSG